MLTAEEQEQQRALLDAAAERVGSLAELARRLGRDIRTTRRWRSGESPVPDVVREQLQQIAATPAPDRISSGLLRLGLELQAMAQSLERANAALRDLGVTADALAVAKDAPDS